MVGFRFSLLLFAMLMVSSSFAQVQDSKTIKKRYDGKTALSLSHTHGPILVKDSPDDKVYIEATISAKAKNRENIDIVLDHFEIDESGLGNRLELETTFKTQSWNSHNGVVTIKFKDGEKAKGIRDIKLSATLLIPGLEKLELNNKYGRIDMEAKMPEDLAVQLFSGELDVKEDCKNLDLKMKYSEAKLPNAGEAKMELFDSELEIGGIRSADVNSKYSEVEVGTVAGDLTMTTFDDNWKIGKIKGKLKIADKYSEFEIESFDESKCTFFDAEVAVISAGNFTIENSKYSKFKIGELARLEMENSFDDNFLLGETGFVVIHNSKYSEYGIEHLGKAFQLNESFDDEVDLGKVSSKFSSIIMSGKYTELDFRMADGAQFGLDVNMQHGDFEYPERDLDVRIYKEKDSNLIIKGYVGGEDKTVERKVTIRGFNNDVVWH